MHAISDDQPAVATHPTPRADPRDIKQRELSGSASSKMAATMSGANVVRFTIRLT